MRHAARDGWTVFCCTINGGHNSCPPGSFVGRLVEGRQRGVLLRRRPATSSTATRAARRRAPATAPAATCDGRRTCCNQFRYGQCHQEIACYGPVVCRVATCTPPWQYDPSCTSTSATDNATVNHGAPCLSNDCISDIERLYRSMGGAGGSLGPVALSEREVSAHTGRYAKYQHGYIFQRYGAEAHEVHGSVATLYEKLDLYRGELGWPTARPN